MPEEYVSEGWSVEMFSEDQGSDRKIHGFCIQTFRDEGVADSHQRRRGWAGTIHVRSTRFAVLALIQAGHPRNDGQMVRDICGTSGTLTGNPSVKVVSPVEPQPRSKRKRRPGVLNVEAKAVTVALISRKMFVIPEAVFLTASTTNASTVWSTLSQATNVPTATSILTSTSVPPARIQHNLCS